jgi:hypothetical protein
LLRVLLVLLLAALLAGVSQPPLHFFPSTASRTWLVRPKKMKRGLLVVKLHWVLCPVALPLPLWVKPV